MKNEYFLSIFFSLAFFAYTHSSFGKSDCELSHTFLVDRMKQARELYDENASLDGYVTEHDLMTHIFEHHAGLLRAVRLLSVSGDLRNKEARSLWINIYSTLAYQYRRAGELWETPWFWNEESNKIINMVRKRLVLSDTEESLLRSGL